MGLHHRYSGPGHRAGTAAGRAIQGDQLRRVPRLRASPGWDAGLLGEQRKRRGDAARGRAVRRDRGGSDHTCALRADGSPVCWGNSDYGQATPPEGERFATVSSGANHTCALRADGAAVCWGAALGDKYTSYGYTTVVGWGQSEPPEGERFSSISSGASHTCGLRLDGTVLCWGKGFSAAT